MKILDELYYTKNHEWMSIENDIAIIGITDFAQSELGDIIFIELPEINTKVDKDETIGTIEAVKTVADLYSPVKGVVADINSALEDEPDKINNDPYKSGWIVKIANFEIDKKNLLNSKQYNDLIN